MAMSMSTHIRGIVPPDETWQQMKAAWDACETAGVPIPDAVYDFFDGEPPDPEGVVVSIPFRDWKGDMESGYEVDVADLPEHVKTIRFWNEW
jgi:hypothetical protein